MTKSLFTLAAIIVSITSMAQTYSVKVGGDLPSSSWERVNGIGLHVPVEWSVRTNLMEGHSLLLTKAEAIAYTNTWSSEIAAWNTTYSNLLWLEKSASTQNISNNLARLEALYQAIPEARASFSQGRDLLSTVGASLASGTNTQAQVVARIRQMVTVQDQTIRYLDGIAEILQRLGPVLKKEYSPELDVTP